MSILDSFTELMTSNAELFQGGKIYNSTTAQYVYSETSKGTFNCAFYEGRSAERIVGERIRSDVDGVFIFNPDDLFGLNIKEDDILKLNNIKYSVIHKDDVMKLNDVLVVAVKELKNG